MKLLFDENLSPTLVSRLATEFPGSRHVEDLGLRGRSDEDIWAYARAEGFTIVSKDNDFRQMAVLQGPPPKVIWLSIGNVGSRFIAELIARRASLIGAFIESADESLLVLEAGAVEGA